MNELKDTALLKNIEGSKSAVFKICVGRFHEKPLFSKHRSSLIKRKIIRIYRFTSDFTRGNFIKIEEGPFEDKNNFKKKSHSTEKIYRGPYSLVRF